MTSIRKLSSSLLLISFVTTGLWGCAQGNAPTQDKSARVQNVTPKNTASISQSAGIVVRDDLALLLDKMPNIKNATVLMHDQDVYVGLTHIGTEHVPDAAIKGGDNWKGMPWGTQQNPKSAKGMTVDELAKEGINDASDIAAPYSTLTGNISQDVKTSISDLIRSKVSTAKQIYITSVHRDVQKLGSYRHFIVQGGDFTPHVREFLATTSRMFPALPNAPVRGDMGQRGNIGSSNSTDIINDRRPGMMGEGNPSGVGGAGVTGGDTIGPGSTTGRGTKGSNIAPGTTGGTSTGTGAARGLDMSNGTSTGAGR